MLVCKSIPVKSPPRGIIPVAKKSGQQRRVGTSPSRDRTVLSGHGRGTQGEWDLRRPGHPRLCRQSPWTILEQSSGLHRLGHPLHCQILHRKDKVEGTVDRTEHVLEPDHVLWPKHMQDQPKAHLAHPRLPREWPVEFIGTNLRTLWSWPISCYSPFENKLRVEVLTWHRTHFLNVSLRRSNLSDRQQGNWASPQMTILQDMLYLQKVLVKFWTCWTTKDELIKLQKIQQSIPGQEQMPNGTVMMRARKRMRQKRERSWSGGWRPKASNVPRPHLRGTEGEVTVKRESGWTEDRGQAQPAMDKGRRPRHRPATAPAAAPGQQEADGQPVEESGGQSGHFCGNGLGRKFKRLCGQTCGHAQFQAKSIWTKKCSI